MFPDTTSCNIWKKPTTNRAQTRIFMHGGQIGAYRTCTRHGKTFGRYFHKSEISLVMEFISITTYSKNMFVKNQGLPGPDI